ncbi:carbon-nitrogen hydrolase family protein [Roseateles sp.]|uniref:carbon-nitrogen hydrolase family protein n=1 Tax=Roseateles sp. TaxID=1971397 RepID=UPI0039EB4CC1
MRITVCEIPDEASPGGAVWRDLCEHLRAARPDLLLLPEFAFLPAVWEQPVANAALWQTALQRFQALIAALPQLACSWVVGAGPATVSGQRFNQGFAWSAATGLRRLRSKAYLPNEEGSWEANWFQPGPRRFPPFCAGDLRFGLNVCTELWALDSVCRYPSHMVHAVLTPRATGAASTERWVGLAQAVATRTGAYSASSNRWHPDGRCGGVGWLIDPDGRELVRTSAHEPFVTVKIDLSACTAARARYPRYVFASPIRGQEA